MSKLITIFLFSFQFCCMAQMGKIQGQMLDAETKLPLFFVNIWLEGTEISAIKNEGGEFKLDSIPCKEYNLKIKYEGHVNLTSILKVNKSTLDTTIYLDVKCPYNQAKHKPACQICNKKDKIIPIEYGLPSSDSNHEAIRGKIHLGGCWIYDCRAFWYCNRDSTEVRK